MAISDGTYPVAARMTGGTLRKKNLYSNTFAYTEVNKKVAAGSATAILGATSVSGTQDTTITDGITQPDVPRALSVTVGGTATSVQSCSIVVTGVNVEGKTITETFITTIATTGIINGTKAFKRVTSVYVPKQAGSGVTVSVGTLNLLGINHRLYRNNTTVKVYSATAIVAGGYTGLTLQAAPTVAANGATVELNTVTPATTPDGTTFYVICYAYDNWALSPVNDQPEYSTTTSTSSTSTSTSTTTITTSTSSTSSSTSSTTTSTSSTSSSTSSTSTSTTTAP